MARLKIFLKYGKNILKNKNIPKHDEPRDAFKNIFCILINKKSVNPTFSVQSPSVQYPARGNYNCSNCDCDIWVLIIILINPINYILIVNKL